MLWIQLCYFTTFCTIYGVRIACLSIPICVSLMLWNFNVWVTHYITLTDWEADSLKNVKKLSSRFLSAMFLVMRDNTWRYSGADHWYEKDVDSLLNLSLWRSNRQPTTTERLDFVEVSGRKSTTGVKCFVSNLFTSGSTRPEHPSLISFTVMCHTMDRWDYIKLRLRW